MGLFSIVFVCLSFLSYVSWQMLCSSIRARLFRPIQDPHLQVPDDFKQLVLEQEIIVKGTGQSIHVWCLFPHERNTDQGVVLFCPGNSFNMAYYIHQCLLIAETLDLPVVMFDYPGYGKSTGKPSPKTLHHSANIVFDTIVKKLLQVDKSKVVIYGMSLGTHIATRLAKEHQINRLILDAPVPDVAQGAKSEYPGIIGKLAANCLHNMFNLSHDLQAWNKIALVISRKYDNLVNNAHIADTFKHHQLVQVDAGHSWPIVPKRELIQYVYD